MNLTEAVQTLRTASLAERERDAVDVVLAVLDRSPVIVVTEPLDLPEQAPAPSESPVPTSGSA